MIYPFTLHTNSGITFYYTGESRTEHEAYYTACDELHQTELTLVEYDGWIGVIGGSKDVAREEDILYFNDEGYEE